MLMEQSKWWTTHWWHDVELWRHQKGLQLCPETLAVYSWVERNVELASETLLIKTLHTWAIGHEEIKLIPKWKLHCYSLVFILLEGSMHAAGGAGESSWLLPSVEPCELQRWLACQDLPADAIVVWILWEWRTTSGRNWTPRHKMEPLPGTVSWARNLWLARS